MNNTFTVEMKVKNEQGGYDITYPISKATNIKTKEEITVKGPANEPVAGLYTNGQTIPADTSLEEVVSKLVQKRVPPTYLEPTLVLKNNQGTAPGEYEVGTSIEVKLSSTFTQRDAGAVTHHKINENGSEVHNVAIASTGLVKTLTLTEGSTKYTANVAYEEGPTKQDNLSEDYATGKIEAGDITTEEGVEYVGIRLYFTKSDTTATAPSSSAEVRAMVKSSTAAKEGTEIVLSALKGDKRVVFAYPATIRDVSSVKYIEGGNDEVKDLFNKTTVNVEGLNGFEAAPYKVYTFTFPQALKANMTFKITL